MPSPTAVLEIFLSSFLLLTWHMFANLSHTIIALSKSFPQHCIKSYHFIIYRTKPRIPRIFRGIAFRTISKFLFLVESRFIPRGDVSPRYGIVTLHAVFLRHRPSTRTIFYHILLHPSDITKHFVELCWYHYSKGKYMFKIVVLTLASLSTLDIV